jgi:cell wall-associated NlpC family hydrolase
MHNSKAFKTEVFSKFSIFGRLDLNWKVLGMAFAIISLSSCGSTQRISSYSQKSPQSDNPYHDIYFNESAEAIPTKIRRIADNALSFRGTPYSYGGTTKNGMDCSGLIYVSFQEENVSIPRISRNMAKTGKRLRQRQIEPGDLLFFQTSKSHKRINHVGLVLESNAGSIKFIHSTTSRGVIVSTLKNPYWKRHFVVARRVM